MKSLKFFLMLSDLGMKPLLRLRSKTQAQTTMMNLSLSLQHLPGVTVSDARKLKQLNIRTIADLLHYYPRKHLAFKREFGSRN
ncbi:MAG: hypothetical protein AB4426_19685 [Xenococcaceae cyanobacterium]